MPRRSSKLSWFPPCCFAALCRSNRHAQQGAGIAGEDLLALGGAELGIVDEGDRVGVGLKWPIDREQDTANAELRDRALQRRMREIAGRGDVEVVAKIIGEAALELAAASERIVGAPQEIRQPFAEMAEDDLELGKRIERAAHHQASGLHRHVDAEAERGAGEQRIVLVVDLEYGGRRRARMQIDRNVERLRAFEDRPELPLVEKVTAA